MHAQVYRKTPRWSTQSNFSAMLMTGCAMKGHFRVQISAASDKFAVLYVHFIQQLGLCIMDQECGRKQPPKASLHWLGLRLDYFLTLVSDDIFGLLANEWHRQVNRTPHSPVNKFTAIYTSSSFTIYNWCIIVFYKAFWCSLEWNLPYCQAEGF